MEEIYDAYLIFWLGLSAMLASFAGMAVYWAVKNKQFSNQESARKLPLISGLPDLKENIKSSKK